jgi:acetoacetate decarboxylase
MKQEDVLKQLTTPICAPAFPRGPFRFNNREYLNILYRTDINALRGEPLTLARAKPCYDYLASR